MQCAGGCTIYMNVYVLEDNLRYAVQLDTEEAEEAEILVNDWFNMQALMQYIIDLPEIRDAVIGTGSSHPNAHIEMTANKDYVLIAIDFDQDCDIDHIRDEGNALTADIDSISDPIYLQALRMHIQILDSKVKMIQSGEMDKIQERIENEEFDEFDNGNTDDDFESRVKELIKQHDKQAADQRSIFVMKDSSRALDNIMMLRDVLEHQKLLGKGTTLYKDKTKHKYYLDVSAVDDDVNAMMTGYAALEMGFERAVPIHAYLKEHCTIFPIL